MEILNKINFSNLHRNKQFFIILIIIIMCVTVFVLSSKSSKEQIIRILPERMITDDKSITFGDKVRILTNCHDRPLEPKIQQRGEYWVLYNYIPAEKRFKCHESITYTTHGDFTFLDNVVPLIRRWRGPISIALHAPGSDFLDTINTIRYLRDCTDSLVKELITFHIYFSNNHIPKEVPPHEKVVYDSYNCKNPPPYISVNTTAMYKNQNNLLYPVNVGRNIARETAQTHFVLPSDIELYPSLNIITSFLEMIARNEYPLTKQNRRVFPLHLFEVEKNETVPDNKTALEKMIINGTAIPFHKRVCPNCHAIPHAKEWHDANETKGINVFYTGKRTGPFKSWEPIYIGTHAEPLYEERLSWEGKSDKMTQGYTLCVLDYDFHVLDNAFLVHKPGIKVNQSDKNRDKVVAQTNSLKSNKLFPELKVLFGERDGCKI